MHKLPKKQQGFLLNPYRFGSAAVPLALDSYTAGLFAALGITRLLTSYTGALLRVRRSSDNTEQDIGYTAGAVTLDTVALAAFVGSGSGFITKWYDQSGSGNHFVQATTANQPRIVNAGTYDGKIVFNASVATQGLKSPVATASVGFKSIFRKVNRRAANANAIEFEYGDSALIGGASGASQLQMDNGTSVPLAHYLNATTTNNFYTVNYTGVTETGNVLASIFKKNQGSAASSFALYAGGILQAQTSPTGAGTHTGNFPLYAWNIGCRDSTHSFGAQIDMYNCVVYDADKSIDALAINTALT